MDAEYRFHKAARTSLNIVAVLCAILIFPIPLAIWIFVRTAGAKVALSQTGVFVRGLGTAKFDYADVARLGTGQVRIVARGIGGALLRARVGGTHATHVWVALKSGTTRKFIASSYDDFQDMMAKLSERVAKPYEQLQPGAWGLKWPGVGSQLP